ncbi:MAG: trypsin-like serine protease [Chloroflexota bacterium]
MLLLLLTLWSIQLIQGTGLAQAQSSAEIATRLHGLSIWGPSEGIPHKPIQLSAHIIPKEATNGVKYLWSPEPSNGQGTAVAIYHWPTAGKEIIKVIATDQLGSNIKAEKILNIAQEPSIPVQHAILTVSPAQIVQKGETISISVNTLPANATEHTVRWIPEPASGRGKDMALYVWTEPGEHQIRAIVLNEDGSQVEETVVLTVLESEPTAVTETPNPLPSATPVVSPPASLTATPSATPTEQLRTATATQSIAATPIATSSPLDKTKTAEPTPTWTEEATPTRPVHTPTPNNTVQPTAAPIQTVTPTGTPTLMATTQPGVPHLDISLTPTTTLTVVSDPDAQNQPSQLFLPLIASNSQNLSNRQSSGDSQASQNAQGVVAQGLTIVGGQEAVEGAWPWQAAIYLLRPIGDPLYFCGGSLIESEWILTAAHCVEDLRADDLLIILGRHRLSDTGGEEQRVSQIFIYDGFQRGTLDADIGLLKLSQPSSQQPVSLGMPAFGPGDLVTATGWGRTVFGEPDSRPDELLQVTIPVISWHICDQAYNGRITANMFCAGEVGRDACQGDSGGPLHFEAAETWHQIGIVSWGQGCGDEGFPGVYTDLSQFEGWIQERMNPPEPSGDDHEPDDTFAEARLMPTDGIGQRHTFHVADDEDWRYFNATEGFEYTVETSDLDEGTDTVLALFRPNGTKKIAEDDDSAGNRGSRLIWTAPQSGRFYVQLQNHPDYEETESTGYTLRIQGQAPEPEELGDLYEPNNLATDAGILPNNGSSQHHTIHQPGDEDWSQIDVIAGQTYTIRTANLQGGIDTFLQLYAADGTTLLSEQDDQPDGDLHSTIKWRAERTESLLLRVTHYDISEGHPEMVYELSLASQPSEPRTGDSAEPDNEPLQGPLVPADGTRHARTFHKADDEDWVQFSVSAGNSYKIETSQLISGSDTILELYGTDGALLLAVNDDLASGDLRSQIVWQADENASYFVRVRGRTVRGNQSEMGYTLSIHTQEDTSLALGDAFEQDDDSTSSTFVDFHTYLADTSFTTDERIIGPNSEWLSPNGPIQIRSFHRPGDKDWVHFDAVSGNQYVLETSNLRGGADTILTIYASDGTTILESNDDTVGRASLIEWTATEDAQVFVKIHSYGGWGHPQATYDFTIYNPQSRADLYESDDEQSQGARIKPSGSTQLHTFHHPQDQDWLLFYGIAGVPYRVETFNLEGSTDTVLALYDQDGTTLLQQDDDNGTGFASRIDWVAPSDGIYSIKVTDFRGEFGTSVARNRASSITNLAKRMVYQIGVYDLLSDKTADEYEPDNLPTDAFSTMAWGERQPRTFHQAGDGDWVQFEAQANISYRIETSNLQGGADTVISLWDQAGEVELAVDDDSGVGVASRLDWTSSSDGAYTVLIRNYSSESGGPGVRYDLQVTSTDKAPILNGDFESGNSTWLEQSANGYMLIVNPNSELALQIPAHSGISAAWLGGAINEVSSVTQFNITVPSDAPLLTYWHWIDAKDSCGHDFGGVAINGIWFHKYPLCISANTDGWVQISVDLTPYLDQMIDLSIVASNDAKDPSSLFVDKIELSSINNQ